MNVDALAEGYIQNTGWTPDGSSYFGKAWAIGRNAMPNGLAVQTHLAAEHDRVASISIWDGTMTSNGHAVDFMSADFLRIEDGVAAEHWDTVDYARLYQSFGPRAWREHAPGRVVTKIAVIVGSTRPNRFADVQRGARISTNYRGSTRSPGPRCVS
jgi:SnoaL-like polyketide cyclase.